tara:strand:- start:436 stop:642 length:207 start_codon:yes stop_codon:yes gene_type:complete
MSDYKSFKTMWEEVPANNASSGAVSMPADAVHAKKKRKAGIYDGRTTAGRKFVERMIARREARKPNVE